MTAYKRLLPALLLLSLCTAGAEAQAPAATPPGVVVAPARVTSFPLAVEALGNASANEAIEIRPLISARLSRVNFQEGQYVEAGTMLAELENIEPLADLAAARATLADSEAQYQRLSQLYKTNVVAQSELQGVTARREADLAAVAAAEARLAYTVISAPFAGNLGLRRVSAGSLVGPETVITTLDDTGSIKLDFDVPEVHIALLRPGLSVTARSAAYPDAVFSGEVTSVDTRVDPVSRTIMVRSQVDNASGQLRAGMFLTVSLLQQDIQALVIPEQAIVPERSQQFVWRVTASGVAELREVSTGRRRPGEVEILAGLAPGDQVIVEGTQKARDGQPVTLLQP
ncbi:MAG: efflux RND transporter periplasmic adaptor subunit [Xanthomonadales bacterium]|nr:efflux RND transporter periplasmic adaptor subunit [Xanthomonadales bacterium]